jgi:Spy/CpxP family protein refolding chaperone
MFKTKEMYMKQIVITIVAAVMFSMTAMAQDQEKGNKKEEMIKHRTEMMVKDYNLDEKQAKQLLELNTKYADKIRPRHHGPHGRHHGMKGERPEPPKGDCQESPEGDKKCDKKCGCQKPSKEEKEAKRKERKENMKAYDAELQKILTPDQYKEYQADREKHHKRDRRQ